MIYLMYKSAKFGLVLTVTYLQIYIYIYIYIYIRHIYKAGDITIIWNDVHIYIIYKSEIR